MIKKMQNYLFNSNNGYEIPMLLENMAAENVVTPVCQWGCRRNLLTKAGLIHFYTDDFRFSALYKDPTKVLLSSAELIVEPNLSIFDTTPIAIGLYRIFQKRWIARYWQECGKKIYVDLNVSPKFYEHNLLGIPQGYNAFATRGCYNYIDELYNELQLAQRVSQKEVPNMLVYGGGKCAMEFCAKHGLTYIDDGTTEVHKK